MTDPTGQRLEHIMHRLRDVGPWGEHLDLLDELAAHLLQAHRRIQTLERLLDPSEHHSEPTGPSTAVSQHSIGQRLKAAAADVVVTPPTFTSTSITNEEPTA